MLLLACYFFNIVRFFIAHQQQHKESSLVLLLLLLKAKAKFVVFRSSQIKKKNFSLFKIRTEKYESFFFDILSSLTH